MTSYDIAPDDLGLAGAPRAALAGGGPEENAAILRSLFAGETGPKRDALLANAAAALVVAGKADDLPAGVRLAAEVIDNGGATAKLGEFAAFTQTLES